MTVAELIYGAHNSDNFAKHENDYLDILSVASLIRVLDSLSTYGKEKARLRRAGLPIPELDLLIATTAVYHGMTLVTNNTKHMTRIENIRLENWKKVEDNVFIE